jgi:hypothetical protein
VTPSLVLTAASGITGGAFQFSLTGTPGATFNVLATGDLSLNAGQWPSIGTMTEVSPGHYQFSASVATNLTQRFFRVRGQ